MLVFAFNLVFPELHICEIQNSAYSLTVHTVHTVGCVPSKHGILTGDPSGARIIEDIPPCTRTVYPPIYMQGGKISTACNTCQGRKSL